MTFPTPIPSNRRAFSLGELLLALVVLAVLAMLAIPAFSHARRKSLDLQCLTHLRSSGVIVHRYIADHNGVFRSFLRGGNTGMGIWGLQLKHYGYLDDPSILRCPAGESEFAIESNSWAWNTYAFNMAAPDGSLTPPAGNAQNYFLPLRAVQNPARRPMLVDSAKLAEMRPGVRSQTFRVNVAKVSDGIQLRHNAKANVLFMDGHAEALDHEAAKEWFNPEYIYDANHRF